MRLIKEINGEGFLSKIEEDSNGVVTFVADADIDADGANGQFGGRPAYTVKNDGSELLANGGMERTPSGKVVPKFSWYEDIVILDKGKKSIRVFPNGIIASKTAYIWPNLELDDPNAYVDSETIPYIAIPPIIIQETKGAVKGCQVYCQHLRTGKSAWGMVADVGPRTKNGEVSIAMARLLGVNPSPRTGGEDYPRIKYTIWPGIHAKINGKLVPLMRSNGKYIFPKLDDDKT